MTALSKTIHTGFGVLGIRDKDEQRAIYSRVTGKPELKLMSAAEEEAVVVELRRLGFNPAEKQGRPAGQPGMGGKYSPKIRALWIALYNLGAINDRRDSAITAFVQGQVAVDAVTFVHHFSDANAVIGALQAIAARHGVDWSNPPRCATWMRAPGYKIALAQWQKLVPQSPRDFWFVVTDMIGQPETYRDLTDAEWITVMNNFGESIRTDKRVREARKAGSK